MNEIRKLFKQMYSLLSKEMDEKTYQELHSLANELLMDIAQRRREKQLEWKESITFFQNADATNPFSFGQCGNCAYWKIVNGVLHIGGNGPMWDFDNLPVKHQHQDRMFSPWREFDYNMVVIHSGVTTIGTDAFHGATLSAVIIPHSIKTIKSMAFFGAKIERLVLPETIETIEEGILNGFSKTVDSLTVSVNIPNIQAYAFFHRDDIVANTIFLSGNIPEDFMPIVKSCLFDGAKYRKIFYPEEWDSADASFKEKISEKLFNCDNTFLRPLIDALTPYTA